MAKVKKGKVTKKAVKKSAVKKPGLFSRLLGKKKPSPKVAKKSVKKAVKKPAIAKKAVKAVKKPVSKKSPKPLAPKKPENLAALKKIAREPIRKEEAIIIEEEDLGPAYEPILFKPHQVHLKEDKILTAEGWKRLFEMGVVHIKKDF